MTDRRRLERIVGNPIANGRRGPAMVDEATITVTDTGPGHPEYLLTRGPKRFRPEGMNKGHGLGLTIAAGQAEAPGAARTFRNTPPCVAEAHLTLPVPHPHPHPHPHAPAAAPASAACIPPGTASPPGSRQ